ncbi:MFS transporter [Larsenimonas salina]|uniref:MFS transporter n=1 Tax=Larsenimonas salina TaxID=1295565 RepID=UPI0020734F40|nr:MFS transporter [Larsenimonas salina]MCM5704527.1 MFS transporter [Larsenimonas salina]
MIKKLWPLVLGGFALGLDAYVLAGLLPAMATELGTTQATIGIGVALFTGAYAISAPVLASLSARVASSTALLMGLGIFTLGNALTAFAPSVSILLIARLIAGVGAGLYAPIATSCAASMVEPHQRGQALSLVLAGLSIGTALGVPAGLLIEAHFGWRWTIGAIVLLSLLAAGNISSRTAEFPAQSLIGWKARLKALNEPFIRRTLGVTLWTGIASLGLYTYIAELLAARSMAGMTDGFIWLWGLGGMAGALAIGRLIDRRLTSVKATAVLLILLGSGFLLVGYAPATAAGIGCFIWGLSGWASMAPQQHALVSYSSELATASIAWNSSANYLGSGLGAALGALALHSHLLAEWLPNGALIAVAIAMTLHLVKARRMHAA